MDKCDAERERLKIENSKSMSPTTLTSDFDDGKKSCGRECQDGGGLGIIGYRRTFDHLGETWSKHDKHDQMWRVRALGDSFTSTDERHQLSQAFGCASVDTTLIQALFASQIIDHPPQLYLVMVVSALHCYGLGIHRHLLT